MANPLKKTMVYLGLADEEEYVEEGMSETPVRSSHREENHDDDKPAPVTPLRRPTVVRQPAADAVNEIVTVHPKQYRDAQTIAEQFRDGLPVIINVSQMSDADARRLIDFASGLSMGLYGRIERVTSKVFLLSPENVAISGDGGIAPADDTAFGS
ncbi:cell division protein SepF [Microbacterium faecale]|uniref:Cell division protein SepF n=1 Tax=Microbacterium faecale TaxID=1804630 RepID=A0A916YEY9_9MICO|nr:cell division protein SepF [Microbacterium faecale]GGD42225.1 cell division protein SepF [Microbacterium faecale]